MLGPLQALHEDVDVPLGDQQQRFVLVVLLLHANKPVSAERLTEILWGDNPDRRTLVRTYMNRLRKTLGGTGDVSILTTPTGYTLRIGEDQLDTSRFERLRAEGKQAAQDDPHGAISLLRSAVGLWRGRFLEDIDIDRVGGIDVVSPDESYVHTVADLAELELTVGDHQSARDRLRPVVKSYPAIQRLAVLLMRALIASGDPVGALQVFQDTEKALAERRVEPGPVLRNLAARAERGEPAGFLAFRPDRFTGRADELAVIRSAAAATGGRRAVWVSGAPGVGKTGLAIEAAHQLRDRFPDGQLLVRLKGYTPNAHRTAVADALTQLLTDLGVPPEQIPATESRKVSLYQTQLYGTKRLVVLDNAHSADQVRSLLPDADGCLAIVTSGRMGEPGTGVHIRLSPLSPDDATELFTALAEAAPRLRGKSAEVGDVVKRCGYLPMPIRVAAALLHRHVRWPLDYLLRLLEENGPWRAGDDDGAAAVRVSYQQLDQRQRELFRLFGRLPGPHLDVSGAAALLDVDPVVARTVLDELHEVCLLEEVALERYQMLDPLKKFAADEPAANPEDALHRLLDHYVVALTGAVGLAYPFDLGRLPAPGRARAAAPRFADADAALGWIDAERDNLVAAIHYAADHGLPGHAWRLAVLIWRYFNTANQIEDWLETLELARRVVSAAPEDQYGHAHVLLRLATAKNRLGRTGDALELAERALPIWVRLGDVHGEAATLCAIAIPTMELGKHVQAIAYFQAALDKYAEVGDQRGQGHALSMLGHLNELRGHVDTALGQHLAAVPMLREVGHLQGLAHALNNLGSVQQRLGSTAEALASHTEAHHLARDLGDDCVAAYALNYIANTHRLRGSLTEAVRHHEQARKIAEDLTDADLHTQLYRDRGATAHAGGDNATAFRAYQSALDLASGTDNRTHLAQAHHGLARTLHAMRRHTEAAEHWTAAESQFAAVGQPEADEVRGELAGMTCGCR